MSGYTTRLIKNSSRTLLTKMLVGVPGVPPADEATKLIILTAIEKIDSRYWELTDKLCETRLEIETGLEIEDLQRLYDTLRKSFVDHTGTHGHSPSIEEIDYLRDQLTD